jgi:Bacterial TSP3 repeat/Domain of unknown function (DUF5122) beta-propeller
MRSDPIPNALRRRAESPEQNGEIVLAGSFDNFNGQPVPGLVRLHSRGVSDGSFVPGVSGTVADMQVDDEGRYIVAGHAHTGTAFLTRLRSNGNVDLQFQTRPRYLRRICIRPHGRVLVAGFDSIWQVIGEQDQDGDGMSDVFETASGFDPGNPGDGAHDTDADGVPNTVEFARATDPRVADTDGDGLNDGAEVNMHHTSPGNPDTDGDGVDDGGEVRGGTSPLDPADSVPAIPSITAVEYIRGADGATDSLRLSWASRPSALYAIEVSEDLLIWRDEVTGYESAGAESSLTVEPGFPAPLRLFFRVRLDLWASAPGEQNRPVDLVGTLGLRRSPPAVAVQIRSCRAGPGAAERAALCAFYCF